MLDATAHSLMPIHTPHLLLPTSCCPPPAADPAPPSALHQELLGLLDERSQQLHAATLHSFQQHCRPVHGTDWPWHAVRVAALLDLKPREANRRQLLCMATHDDRAFVLKTCATDSLAQAHAERLTCLLSHAIGVAAPTVVSRAQ